MLRIEKIIRDDDGNGDVTYVLISGVLEALMMLGALLLLRSVVACKGNAVGNESEIYLLRE